MMICSCFILLRSLAAPPTESFIEDVASANPFLQCLALLFNRAVFVD
jgi:hypothetical protein